MAKLVRYSYPRGRHRWPTTNFRGSEVPVRTGKSYNGLHRQVMSENSTQQVTRLLVDWSNGDQSALEQLTPLVYSELRRLAGRYLRKERSDHTLQSTALGPEAFLGLIAPQSV